MNERAPFQPEDLQELDDRLLHKADEVVPMCDILDGNRDRRVIGLRHDVDDNPGSLDAAVNIAEWEAERGYRSTFFLLHTASYWREKGKLRAAAAHMEALGHEIGIHNNAVIESLETGVRPQEILFFAVNELRSYGLTVRGTVAHGDSLCQSYRVVNDEMFLGCQRPDWGAPDRVIQGKHGSLMLKPEPLGLFGLEYDANWLPRSQYLSDSGGRWSRPFDEACYEFPPHQGQLHVLWHPDWWVQAFVAGAVV